jgi:GntR family transcriptional regulator
MTLLRVDRRSLALQLRDRIWEMIQEGTYRPGEKVPPEQELAARFGVSRATVREALRILQEERVILSRHGIGHFVAPDPSSVLSEEITRLKSVTELAHERGLTIGTYVLSLREETPEEGVREHLNLESGETAVVLERVRLAQGEPIIYSVDVFPRRIVVGELCPEEFAGSLLAVMEGKWNARLAYSKTLISAVNLDPSLSQRIGAPDRVAWILMEQVNYDAQDRPLLYSKDYHRGDKFQFRVLRRRR